jgi:hypothetical protein
MSRKLRRGETNPSVLELGQALGEGITLDNLPDVVAKAAPGRFFLDPDVRGELTEALDQIDRGWRERTVAAAEKVMAHTFDLLGSGDKPLGEKIDWHRDFKTGYRWPEKEYFRRIDLRLDRGDCDVKVPWELSRFQHLPTLARAYWATGDERYPGEFVSEVLDWISSNPPAAGVNWACPMDVAIRVVNWLYAYHLLLFSPRLERRFHHAFYSSVLAHGRFIAANLEGGKGRNNTNHYLSNLAGLFFLGLLAPELKESDRWLRTGRAGLETEMKVQVLRDGVDYELSIGYHRLVTEIFLWCHALGRKNGVVFPRTFEDRLEKMIAFACHYTRPDGTVPVMGDADNGRLLRLADWAEPEREFFDHRHLLASGAVVFNRQNWAVAAGDAWEDTVWMLGTDAVSHWKKIAAKNRFTLAVSDPGSRSFPDGGIHVMRKGPLYSIMDTGMGCPAGAHFHNDTLSFEIYAHGCAFIVDPGSYVYSADPEARNLFRSTRHHNTIEVDGTEMNRMDPADLFALGKDARTRTKSVVPGGGHDLVSCSHTGYRRLAGPVTIKRLFFFSKTAGLWLVRDESETSGEHSYLSLLHFGKVELARDTAAGNTFVAKGKDSRTLLIMTIDGPAFEHRISEGWVSRSYGRRFQAPVLESALKTRGPWSSTRAFVPSPSEPPAESELVDRLERALKDFKQVREEL